MSHYRNLYFDNVSCTALVLFTILVLHKYALAANTRVT